MSRSKKSLVGVFTIFMAAAIGGSYVRRAYLPRIVATGNFHQVAHKGEGTVTISQLADGTRILRLTQFSTTDRSDLDLLLISATDASENEAVKNSEVFVLGSLKRTQGDQEYLLPPGLDFDRYHAVTIWSRKYGVNCTTAPLRRP